MRLANSTLDEVRRRVQNDTLGGRGTKHDPLYRTRKLLTMAHERLSDAGDAKLRGLLAAGDPRGEVRDAWHAKETLRDIYKIPDRRLARRTLDELARDLRDPEFSPELNRLGRTLRRWAAPTHRSRQQPRQAHQASLVRNHQLRPLPHQSTALRRQTRLDPAQHPHSPIKREEPVFSRDWDQPSDWAASARAITPTTMSASSSARSAPSR